MVLSRRMFLLISALTSRWSSALSNRRARSAGAAPASAPVSFQHGVASGDPLRDAVVLWTRVTSEGEPDGRVEGEWVLAEDPELARVVGSGRFETDASRDWTVKVDARGLGAGRWYWYGFRVGDQRSPVGRTRTLPDGPVERTRIAVFSCSNLPFGYFHAYRSAAEREDLDLALHLGDYIYEYGRDGYGGEVGARLGREVEPPHELLTLDDYRRRYAQYRSDPDLQAVHASLPMIVVWDDHEIANNTWKSGAQNHTDESEGPFRDRREAAIRAFHEWLPIRSRPGSARDRIYRTHDIGDLATLIMLDTRLIGRDRQIDYATELDASTPEELGRFRTRRLGDPTRTILGVEQEAWLKQELARSKERGVPWQILGQQLLVGELITPRLSDVLPLPPDDPRARLFGLMEDAGLPLNPDAWDGYPAARQRLADDALAFADNLVVLAGDSHNSWGFDLEDREGRRFGVELGTTSVTSPGLERTFPLAPEVLEARLRERNPNLRFVNAKDRGYMVLTVTADEVECQWLYVDSVERREATERVGGVARVRATEEAGTGALEVT